MRSNGSRCPKTSAERVVLLRVAGQLRIHGSRFRQLDLFSTALLIDLVRRAEGDSWRPVEVDLTLGGEIIAIWFAFDGVPGCADVIGSK